MARSDGEKNKFDMLEDTRTDSGIDSFRSLTKDDRCGAGSAADSTRRDEPDKLGVEERLDSAYGSSSLNADSLDEIMGKCSISESRSTETEEEVSENEEENPFATITQDGDTPLHLLIIHEEESFAHELIKFFPKEVLDIQNDLSQTPMHLAVYLNQPGVVSALMGKGACPALQDQDGNTPLHVACEHGRLDCATEMIRNVSAIELTYMMNIQNWRGLTCLHVVVLHRQHKLMRLLIKKGVDLNVQEGTSGKTPLHVAVELHDVEMVRLLLNKGANVDAAMLNGCTALHLAIGRQDADITTCLCQAGADRMIRNMEDETPLDLADGKDDILALFPFDDIQIMGRTIGVNF
ncbi:NF-kappa-B inhibitor epsilon [Brachyhypopomus gauderio]|uniref:NF-kappa-B inhibitor epsilon n=1 Tax=Brachyhypopomus gauderio TaxID=698409 RepID=UPI0040421D0E